MVITYTEEKTQRQAVLRCAREDGATHVRHVERDMFMVYRPSRSFPGAWGTALIYRPCSQTTFMRTDWFLASEVGNPLLDGALPVTHYVSASQVLS